MRARGIDDVPIVAITLWTEDTQRGAYDLLQVARITSYNVCYTKLLRGLRPFDRTAVARVIEQSARLASDAEKLSTHMQSTADLLREADYWAERAKRKAVCAADVQCAIDGQIRRADRLRERLYEEIKRGTILIDSEGEKSGQVNGLSVLQLGDFAFGQPSSYNFV